jgi:hypothetical protein
VNEAKNIILIPHWIHDTLRRHQHPITQALNFSTLRKIVSVNDLVGFLLLNQLADRVGVCEPGHGLTQVQTAWGETVTDEHSDYLYNTVYPLTTRKEFLDETVDRLFVAEARNDQHQEPFHIYDLSSRYEGVVIYPGFYTGEAGTVQHQFHLLKELVKALYVSAPFSEVATTSVFLRYLGLLSKKRIMV